MPSVTVYSTPTCMQCTMTYRALDTHAIAYTVVDVSEVDAAREFVMEELGYSSAPVVVVDDEPQNHWTGFRPDLIGRLAAATTIAG